MKLTKKHVEIIILTLLIISVSQVRAESLPPNSLSFQYYTVAQGQSNVGIGSISGPNSSTDFLIMCASSSGSYGKQYSGCPAPDGYMITIGLVEGSVYYNTSQLSQGTYSFEACDFTYYENTNGTTDCTSSQTVTITAPVSTTTQTTTLSTTIPPHKTCSVTGIAKGYGTVQLYNNSTSAESVGANTSLAFPCGSTVYIYASTGSSANIFTNWGCSGAGCYSGTRAHASLILNNNVTEIANFVANLTISASSTTTSSTTQYTTTNPGHSTASISSISSTTAYTASTTLSVTRADTCGVTVISSVPGAYRFIVGSDLNGTSKVSANYSNSSTLYMHCGSQVTINIEIPPKGYNFSRWECTGTNCYSGIVDGSTFQLDGNVTETAIYLASASSASTSIPTTNESTTSIVPVSGNYSVQSHPIVTPIIHAIDNIWNGVVNFFNHL